MKGIALTIVLAVLMVVSHDTPARAEGGKLGIGIMVGGSKLNGDIQNTQPGLTGGAFMRYWPKPAFAFTASTTYGVATSGVDAIHTDLLTGSLAVSFFPIQEANIKPFVTLGVSNFHYVARDNQGRELLSTAGDRSRAWDHALQVGAGLELQTGENWALNTSINYTITGNDRLDAIVEGSNDHFFTGMLGIVRYVNLNPGSRHPDLASKRKFLEAEEITSERRDDFRSEPVDPQRAELFSDGIYFEAGSSKLLEDSQEHLDKIYQFLYVNEGEKLQLIALTDAASSNPQLLIDRAQAVKTYLVKLGIKPSRITIQTE